MPGFITPEIRKDVIRAFRKHGWKGKTIAQVFDVQERQVNHIITRYLKQRREGQVIIQGVPSRINEAIAAQQHS